MNQEQIERYISKARLDAYSGIKEYSQNLLFSRHFYIPLAVLEVALRNSINDYLTTKVGDNWLENETLLCKDARRKIDEAKNKLSYRHEPQTNDKIIAELNFGFWVGLFTKPYENYLRHADLKKIFPSLPSKKTLLVTRRTILSKLHTVKTFRNRIFHYEKVINKTEYGEVESIIFELLGYFDSGLADFCKSLTK